MNTRGLLVALACLAAACDSPPSEPAAAGRLQIEIVGLPGDVSAQVTVRGPANYSSVVTRSSMLTGLVSGEYRISSGTVRTDSTTYVPADSAVMVTVAGSSATTASVAYALVSGRLAVLLSGLPNGTPAPVTVTGPGGVTLPVTASDTLGNLIPGSYEVVAGNTTAGTDVYAPQVARLSVNVVAAIEPSRVLLTFRVVSGELSVSINGLPPAVPARVKLSGPNGVDRDLTASAPVPGLLAGVYTLSADTVRSGTSVWAPLPTTQKVTLATGSSATVAVSYVPVSPASAGANLTVAAVHFQQVVQTLGGAVPLIEGRDALLRVFVVGSLAGIAAPSVRVQLYNGSAVQLTTVVTPAIAAAPVAVDESTLQGSWNYVVPGALVRPGLGVLVEVDPANQVPETLETDNVWPSAGSPLAVQVRAVPPVSIRFIPVTQAATGLTGRVSTDNLSQFLDATRRLLPVSSTDVVIAPPFTTNAPALIANDSNNAWAQVLNEVNALRAAEGGTAIYYGVVQTQYRSGIAGLAYIAGRAAIGWDHFPGATVVLAHELGHSFGRFHSPCGGAGGVDVSYPYLRGAIGVYGYDAITNSMIDPSASDVMGYCSNVWISDYTFTGMMAYRLANASSFVSSPDAPRPGLLVWGRIVRGQPVLEPAFEVVAPPLLPRTPGRQRLGVRGDRGQVLATLSFEADPIADGDDSTAAQFAFVIPRDAMGGVEPAEITLTARGRRSTLASPAAGSPASATVTATRLSDDGVRLTWPGATRTSGAMVRDRATGRILSFGRNGSAAVRTRARRVEVVVSDGVRSRIQVVDVPPARRPR